MHTYMHGNKTGLMSLDVEEFVYKLNSKTGVADPF